MQIDKSRLKIFEIANSESDFESRRPKVYRVRRDHLISIKILSRNNKIVCFRRDDKTISV